MTLNEVRGFLREHLNELGYREWKDAFAVDNIPSTIDDKSYHILSPAASGVQLNMRDQVIDFDQNVSIIRKGFRNPAEAVDRVVADVQTILCDLLAPENRVAGHLNVKFGGFTIEPLNDENDNSVRATINLSVQVSLGVS